MWCTRWGLFAVLKHLHILAAAIRGDLPTNTLPSQEEPTRKLRFGAQLTELTPSKSCASAPGEASA